MKVEYPGMNKSDIQEPRNVICHAAVQPGASAHSIILIISEAKAFSHELVSVICR